MAAGRQQEDSQELLAARSGAIVALMVAHMMNPGRTKPWTQQELITTLYDRGLGSKEIVTALGIPRTIVDPTLSRYRKAKGKKSAAVRGEEPWHKD